MPESLLTAHLKKVESNLLNEGFRPLLGHTTDGIEVYCKRSLVLTKLSFVETFFVFKRFQNPTYSELIDYSAKTFSFSMDQKKNPLPCGMFGGVECYPVALTEVVAEDVRGRVKTDTPPEHLAAAEMLVVVNTEAGDISFFEGTPFWGAMYWDGRRRLIEKIVLGKKI